MNNERRKSIAIAVSLMERARQILEDTYNEEQDAFDNMPESLQESERGQNMEEIIRVLEEAAQGVETAIDEINELDDVAVDVTIDQVRKAII